MTSAYKKQGEKRERVSTWEGGEVSNTLYLNTSSDPHLPQEVDTSSNYEGRDGRADHSEEGNGADVLEEVTLKIHGTVSHVNNL